MKILFVTQYDEIHSSFVLKKLLESSHEVIGVITSKTLIHRKGLIASLLEIIKKSGFKYLVMRIIEGIYIKFYEYFKLFGIDRFKKYSPCKVKDLIKKYKLGHIAVEDINSKNSLKIVKELKPDIIVCCVFNQIFGDKVLKIPKYGCINIHRSLLPKYRGVSPTFWVLANNEKTTGITIHEMAKEIDAGNILAQKEVKILKDDTVNTLSFRLMQKGSILLEEVLDKFEKNKPAKKIKIKSSKYYTWPSKDAVKIFIKNKRKLL